MILNFNKWLYIRVALFHPLIDKLPFSFWHFGFHALLLMLLSIGLSMVKFWIRMCFFFLDPNVIESVLFTLKLPVLKLQTMAFESSLLH